MKRKVLLSILIGLGIIWLGSASMRLFGSSSCLQDDLDDDTAVEVKGNEEGKPISLQQFGTVPDQVQTRLQTGIDPDSPPHLEIDKSVNYDEIWRPEDKRTPKTSTVTLNIKGEGNPAINFNSQDVVFTIDCSASMDSVDPTYLRREAAKSYVDQLISPDNAAVIRFSDTAEVINNHH